jgi:hypothetical protein
VPQPPSDAINDLVDSFLAEQAADHERDCSLIVERVDGSHHVRHPAARGL